MLFQTLYESLFKNLPIGSYLLSPAPDAIILDVNGIFLQTVSLTREDMVGRSLFEVFPNDPHDHKDTGVEALRQSIMQTVATGERQIMPVQRFPIKKQLADGNVIFEERFWNASNTPIFDDDGSVACVLHVTTEVTNEVKAVAALRESEERFRSLVTATSQMVWVAAPGGDIFSSSRPWSTFTGQSQPEAIGWRWLNAVHPEERERIAHFWNEAVSKCKPYEVEHRIRRYDGTYIWTAVRAVPIMNADGSVREWIGTITDIDDKKKVEEELRMTNNRLKLAIEGAGEGVWEWDIVNDRISYSPLFREIVGCLDKALSDNPRDWFGVVHPKDLPRMNAAMQAYLRGQVPAYSCEYRIRCKDGSWKWIHSRGVLVDKSPDGKPLRIAGMVSDITERKESDERIWHLANFDTLTSLPNRRLFRDRLAHEVMSAHRRASRIALLFIDLDGFKQVNDLFGHDAGDILLLQAAHRIKDCVRETDTVARLGGDEFTIILGDLHGADHVEQVAQKVLDALSLPFSIGSEKAFVSGSLGIALYPEDAKSPEELIRKADQAMYAAKNAGKNQFSYFTKEMDEKAHVRLRLIQELRHALEYRQVKVHYQPVVDLQSGRVFKVEALARWTHPVFGNVEPSLFIPLAEESGMINAIGDFVFREAAASLKHWNELLPAPLQISINKSPIQFGAKEQDNWLDHLRQLGLPPACVTVEVTEGVLLDMTENVSSKLLEYRDAGIQVAIDDFGTGYSSLAYLQKFDIDFLKIDQSFVKDMPTNQGNRSIAESIIAMAHRLGLKVIAEGVENREQMELLRQAGCDYGQGFYFSRPLPPHDVEAMLVKQNGGMVAQTLH